MEDLEKRKTGKICKDGRIGRKEDSEETLEANLRVLLSVLVFVCVQWVCS